jgi:hypothetical protein
MIGALLSVALGVWVIAAPDVLNSSELLRVSEHVVGPLVVGLSLASTSPVMRRLRIVNLAPAACLLGVGFITIDVGGGAINAIVVAIVLGSLAYIDRERRGHYGGGWRAVAPLRRSIMRGQPRGSPHG